MPEDDSITAVEEIAEELTAEEQAAVDKAENPDAVRNAIGRQKDAAKEARQRAEKAEARAKELEDASKSEQEKRDEAAADAVKRAETAEAKALRYEIAAAKGVPLTQAHRLQGSSKEELEKDADAFLKDVKGGNGHTTMDGGARQTASTEDSFDAQIRRSAGR